METNRRLKGETNRWGEGRDGRTDPATDQSRTGRTDGRTDGQNPPPPPPFTLGVQQLAEPQVLLGRVEGALQVVGGVGFGQLLEVHEIRPAGGGKRPPRTQIRRVSPQKSPPPPPPKFPHPNPHNPPVFVDEGVEGQAVPPTGGEVLDVHLWVPEAGIGIWGGGQQTTPINMGPGGGWGGVLVFGGGSHPAVFIWHQSSRASLAERVSRLSSVLILITWIWGAAVGQRGWGAPTLYGEGGGGVWEGGKGGGTPKPGSGG